MVRRAALDVRRHHLSPPLLLLLLLLSSPPAAVLLVAANFDPYELNGGLVSAVAGRDYVLIASDTRLTDGGYGVRSRTHLGSRLWLAGPTPRFDFDRDGAEDGDGDDDGGGGAGALPVTPDGSVAMPERCGGGARYRLPPSSSSSLTFVGSSGCSSDCEALKRTLRSEMISHALWTGGGGGPSSGFGVGVGGEGGSGAASISSASVATALMQTLYSRRPFPYYSFCVLAGLDDGDDGTGRVHVYDAIGSHERVAVACAGATGREMLQPVLDRLFVSSSSSPSSLDTAGGGNGGGGSTMALRRDGRSVPAESQRIGNSLSLGPPVATCVDCTPEEAVANIVRAYRSVSEREIGVGDDVVVCVFRRRRGTSEEDNGNGEEGGPTLDVMRFPLKKH